MPDLSYAKKDEIPEELREHAVEKDGAFVVSVAPMKRVTEFRDNNIALKQKLETVEPRLAVLQALVGEDPEKFKGELAEMRDIHQQVKDGKLKGSTAVKDEVDARLASAKSGYEDQLKAAGTKLIATEAKSTEWEAKFKRLALRQELTIAIMSKDSGALPEATPDILACAESDWKVQDDGTLVRMNGDVKVYGASGDPMSPKEWLAGLLKQKPYFAKESAGGGASGGRDPNGLGGLSKEALNKLKPVEKMRLARQAARR